MLRKGLSFAPSNHIDPFSLKVDSFKFYRQLHLKHFFSKPNVLSDSNVVQRNHDSITTTNSREVTPFKKKSRFLPSSNLNPTIVTFSQLVDQDLAKLGASCPINNKNKNMTKKELDALRSLESRQDIVIRPADKGGAVVVMSFDNYNCGILKLLHDVQCYKPLISNPTSDIKSMIDGYINESHTKGWITDKEKSFLLSDHPRCPVFYGLPKIHKRLIDPPLRPIVSGIGSITEPLSQFVDFFLRNYVYSLPSYLGDTTDVLNLINNFTCESNVLLVSLDVQSLYTCIPHDVGLQALSYFLAKRPTDALPPSEFLTCLAELILSNNFFKYAGKFYLQLQGTAMGSAFAPSYACLVMGLWEEKYIHSTTHNPFHSNILLWSRYIDDALCLWKGTVEELKNFLTYINSSTSYLSFTMEHSNQSIDFLDLTIFKDENSTLQSTLYRKPLSRNTLLQADSNHPPHLVRNIPTGQFLRVRRNCSTLSEFTSKASDLARRFEQRGYNKHDISNAWERASMTERTTLLSKKPKSQLASRLSFSTRYNPAASQIKRIVRKHWHVLNSDPALKEICAEPPRFIFRRARNIRDRLVHSDMVPPSPTTWLSNPPKGFYKCNNCAQCSNSCNAKYFSHPRTGKKFPISSLITCTSTHVIYMLKCPCGLAYIGQTKRQLKLRIAEHKTAIRTQNMTYAMARHYKEANHGSPASLKFWGIEKIIPPPRGGDIIRKLLCREAFWIYTLGTLEPQGLNEELSFSCFL